MKVTVNNVRKCYGATVAADNVSFEFSSGKIFGFIGPNGAGKTTTIKIMSTLDAPDSGDVFFDDISVVNYPDKARALLGYMPDSLPSFSDIQVWEYLDFFARCYGLKGERRRKMLADVEEFTSLGSLRSHYLNELSKGMKQRVSLARALIHDPKVLLLDEPAAGLDPRARLDLRNLLKILAEQGKAILLSSHILSELQDICDGAVIIEKGHILSAGTMDTLYETVEAGGDAIEHKKDQIVIVITCLDHAQEICLMLREDPRVVASDVMGDKEVHASILGGEADISPVMARLFAAGMPITGFARQHAGLEDIFMRVTSGEVQ